MTGVALTFTVATWLYAYGVGRNDAGRDRFASAIGASVAAAGGWIIGVCGELAFRAVAGWAAP